MNIQYRDAKKEDCSIIAKYINYASDGVLDLLFEGNSEGMTVAQILNYSLENEHGHDSYRSVAVAEHNAKVVAMVQSYPSIYHKIDDDMRAFFSKERLEQFKEFYEMQIDKSLLLNAMFVDIDYRRKGIGSKLINLTKTKAKSLGFDKVSLFVLADNLNAQKVYKSNGFEIINEIEISGKKKTFLMYCNI